MNLRADLPLRRRTVLQRSWLARTLGGALLILSSILPALGETAPLTLDAAVHRALAVDPTRSLNLARQQQLQAQARAADTLANPRLSVALANLPVDTFAFNEHAMTQLNLGFSQPLPRGDSRALLTRQLNQSGDAVALQQLARETEVALSVGEQWLDLYEAQQSLRLIVDNQQLFAELTEIALTSYASAAGSTRQQDIIRAQLENTNLRDRLVRMQAKQRTALHRLSGWLTDPMAPEGSAEIILADSLPDIRHSHDPDSAQPHGSEAALTARLLEHPLIAALDQRIIAAITHVDLQKQQHRPQWAINANYGLRQDEPGGMERPDFVSVGVSVDLPAFNRKRPDAEVAAAASAVEALRAERSLMLRDMQAKVLAESARLEELDQHMVLIQTELLPQQQEYADAVLTAYTNQESNFVEVIRARIGLLDAQIAALNVAVDFHRAQLRLAYYAPDLITRGSQS